MNFDCKKMHVKCNAGCCGICPIPKDIYLRNQDKIVRKSMEVLENKDSFIPITSDGFCNFLNKDLSCNIYEDRPEVCRKFGNETHPMLFCPFLNKDGNERSRQSKRQVSRDTINYLSKLKVLK